MRLASLENLEDLFVPSSYQIRTYRRGDGENWIKIIKCSFGENFPADINQILDDTINSQEFDPTGLFFITYHDQPVGTVFARQQFSEGHKVGYIHMLGVIPQHQGKGLGRLLTLCALRYFRKKGFREVILDTDDFRISAIKTYLGLGFEPVYLERSHRRRWKAVFEKINSAR
jgi:mycothiol synthase